MNFLRTTFRYLTKDRAFSYVNIFGLAAGLTAVLCITFYVVRESNYDRFHRDADRIYRVSIAMAGEGLAQEDYYFTPPIGPAMKAEVPEVEEYTRINPNKTYVAFVNDKSFKLTDVCYADTSFFNLFTFPLNKGNAQTALATPYSIVLTEETASNFFGNEDPALPPYWRWASRH